ncbi:MAG: acetamidase/formamidase family protein [bacterium]
MPNLSLISVTGFLLLLSPPTLIHGGQHSEDPAFTVADTQTHTMFSAGQKPAVRVPSGSLVEMYTHEATGGQFAFGADNEDLQNVDFGRVHTMTGPVYVEGAEPGGVLAVEVVKVEVADWGWMALLPQFGVFAGEINSTSMRTFKIDHKKNAVVFNDEISVPLKPFAGIMGVAPAPGEPLDTFPPRENGGNMDNPALVEGTTVYFPVFTEGALFSIGDTHAVQGFGEVSGTALEAPMRIVVRLSAVQDARPIREPQYETDSYYATTGFATTLEEAARKATRYMIDYLMAEKGLSEDDAYLLCSIAGDLLIPQMVDLPNMSVTMHMPKNIFLKK